MLPAVALYFVALLTSLTADKTRGGHVAYEIYTP